MTLDLTVDIQGNRKALVLRDTTDSQDEFAVPEGWGTDLTLSDYYSGGTKTLSLAVTVYSYDGSEETLAFDISTLTLLDAMTAQSEMVFLLVHDGTTWSLILTSAFDANDYSEIPDGVYGIVYTAEATPDEIYTGDHLVSEKAESIIDTLGLNLDSKIYSSNTTDLVQLIDILSLDATMFIVNESDEVSERATLLTMLKAINDAEYDYYAD